MKSTLLNIKPLNFSTDELHFEAAARATKMSIQGVQTKLSAIFEQKENRFEIVSQNGRYILKPQSMSYPELPQNEALTMTLAEAIHIEVPEHGLVRAKDNSLVYFIKRFDRKGKKEKYGIEDFAQLSQHNRDTKYKSSMEQVAKILFKFCTFPKIEAMHLGKLILFNFLIGNEDMHLKNFSLITKNKITALSPAYDLLNTTIVQKDTKEEIALPINGKKNNLQKKDFLEYFSEHLYLNEQVISIIFQYMEVALPLWKKLIMDSFLSESMKKKYLELLEERCERLGLVTPHEQS